MNPTLKMDMANAATAVEPSRANAVRNDLPGL